MASCLVLGTAESVAVKPHYRINNNSNQRPEILGPKAMKRFLALLGDLLFHASHSRFERELAGRPELDDESFYEAYYGGSGIPRDIPVRVRKVYVEQLGDCWKGVRPGDNACEAYPDLDFAELLYEIEDEFGIKIPDEAMRTMDGTFDGDRSVRCLTSGFNVMMWKADSNFRTESWNRCDRSMTNSRPRNAQVWIEELFGRRAEV